jgi:hypothetical protein
VTSCQAKAFYPKSTLSREEKNTSLMVIQVHYAMIKVYVHNEICQCNFITYKKVLKIIIKKTFYNPVDGQRSKASPG